MCQAEAGVEARVQERTWSLWGGGRAQQGPGCTAESRSLDLVGLGQWIQVFPLRDAGAHTVMEVGAAQAVQAVSSLVSSTLRTAQVLPTLFLVIELNVTTLSFLLKEKFRPLLFFLTCDFLCSVQYSLVLVRLELLGWQDFEANLVHTNYYASDLMATKNILCQIPAAVCQQHGILVALKTQLTFQRTFFAWEGRCSVRRLMVLIDSSENRKIRGRGFCPGGVYCLESMTTISTLNNIRTTTLWSVDANGFCANWPLWAGVEWREITESRKN